ncbi:unnamed protein product [Paramecium sonneborni]|uniref:Tetratricopeptide repeat protein n=1 Tax=Paramecium sonneborni TaxID=65129 RepID=A0A8S1RPJ1_9CILI|nr:unnamed protein product [Paramecium sonneborni]
MKEYQCRYVNHEKEEIIGFCMNQICQETPQYCQECLVIRHQDHKEDCLNFPILSESINHYIMNLKSTSQQLFQINNQFGIMFDRFFKQMDSQIKILLNMDQKLTNKEYLPFKQQLTYLHQYHSGENPNKYRTFLELFNQILEIIEDVVKNNDLEESKCKEQGTEIYQISKKMEAINKDQEIIQSQTFFENGKQLIYERKYQDALKLFDKALMKDPNNEEIQIWKGQALIYLERFQEANQSYDDAIQFNSQNFLILNNKGTVLNDLQRYQEAIQCYDEAIKLDPNNSQGFCNKGLALKNLNRYEESIYCYDKSIQLNCKNDTAFNNKGTSLIVLKRYQEAIECFDKAFLLNPQYKQQSICIN